MIRATTLARRLRRRPTLTCSSPCRVEASGCAPARGRARGRLPERRRPAALLLHGTRAVDLAQHAEARRAPTGPTSPCRSSTPEAHGGRGTAEVHSASAPQPRLVSRVSRPVSGEMQVKRDERLRACAARSRPRPSMPPAPHAGHTIQDGWHRLGPRCNLAVGDTENSMRARVTVPHSAGSCSLA